MPTDCCAEPRWQQAVRHTEDVEHRAARQNKERITSPTSPNKVYVTITITFTTTSIFFPNHHHHLRYYLHSPPNITITITITITFTIIPSFSFRSSSATLTAEYAFPSSPPPSLSYSSSLPSFYLPCPPTIACFLTSRHQVASRCTHCHLRISLVQRMCAPRDAQLLRRAPAAHIPSTPHHLLPLSSIFSLLFS